MAPKTAFDVRREASVIRCLRHLGLGYRSVQVLALLHASDANGRSLSYREICLETGISTKGEVSDIAGRLERRGLARRVGTGRSPRLRLFPEALKAETACVGAAARASR